MTSPQTSPQIIAFQGEPGAYSQLAVLDHLGDTVATHPCHTFDNVYTAVESGAATHAILPFENSLAGSIHRNYDLILRHNLHVVGETYLRVNHCLLGLPGAQLSQITQAHSHPQALAQCEHNLTRLGMTSVAEVDTAGSARLVKEWGDPTRAAIASTHAAQVYGLDILVDTLEDNHANYTRFLILSPQPTTNLDRNNEIYKTSISFVLKNEPGALFKALSLFAVPDIDLTKIESRPVPDTPWDYRFYIDFIGHQQHRQCARALDYLQDLAAELRILGSYPRAQMPQS